MEEVWKTIKGFSKYEVSNKGHVRRITLVHDDPIIYSYRGVVGSIINNKYIKISLSENGIAETHYLYRLVADHFVSNPHHYKNVRHKDGDTFNNEASNLEWFQHKSKAEQQQELRQQKKHKKIEQDYNELQDRLRILKSLPSED